MRSPLPLVLLLTFALATSAAAQVRIVGRVIDDTTERPLEGAQVTVTSYGYRTKTGRTEQGTVEMDVGYAD